MKKIFAVCLLLFVGMIFAASDAEDRQLYTRDANDSRDADSVDDSAVTDDSTMRDSDNTDTSGEDDETTEDNTRTEDDRRNRVDELRNRSMDRRNDSNVEDRKKCDSITDTDAYNVCLRSIKKVVDNRCEDLEGDNKTLCLRKVKAYGKEYVARERHELNEKCRGLNGTERADCEREINTEFKEYMRQRYLEWKNNTNNTMTDEEKQKIRERLMNSHKEKAEELKNRTSDKKAKLLERLDNAINKAERKVEKMETLIERISSNGHDVTELKYLLEEYQNSLDDARIYYDEEQYRDALASLKEAFRYFHEFKQTVSKILGEHRENRKYKADEEPFAVEEEDTSDEGDTSDDDVPPGVVE